MSEAATRPRPQTRTKKAVRRRPGRPRKLVDVVRKAVDEGATTVEDIHKAVADLPLEIIGRLDGFEDALKDVRRVQKESIGAVYDLIRRVNRDVTRLADDVLREAGRRSRKRARPVTKSGAKSRGSAAAGA